MKTICKIEFCNAPSVLHGMCRKHHWQMKTYGYIRNRIRTDPNEFIIEENICLISLYNTYSEKIAEAAIDIEDMEKCKPYKWHIEGGYVKNKKKGYLHNYLLTRTPLFPAMILVDHKDGNPLDNRKENLQIITNRQNQIKKKLPKNNTSGYRGVFKTNQKEKKWYSMIKDIHKYVYLGSFLTKEEAASAYNEKAKELFGKFAVLNKIGGDLYEGR